jgi:MerR family mercuric resistance operon transcriptional regulator
MSANHEQTGYTIGRLASAAGVNVETVRYYQRRGLIAEPDKPYSGFRQYPSTCVGQIQFIKRAQKLGFSLTEIAELLELGNGHCRDVRKRAEIKRDKIVQQIHDLQGLRDTLEQLIGACRKGGKNSHQCPIVDNLLDS